MARLDAVGSRIGAKERVAVPLANVVPGEVGAAVETIFLGIDLDQVARQLGELPGGGLMLGIGQAGGVLEHRLLQAELAGPARHLVGKGLLGAGNALGNGYAGVIGGLDDHALHQVLELHPGIQLRIHCRPAGHGTACFARHSR